MNAKEKAELYAERAELLAVVYLTRREDVLLAHPQTGARFDLLATLLSDGKTTGRAFGVVTSAVDADPPKTNEPDSGLRNVPIPVCEFVFAMDSDAGFWRWIRQPDDARETGLSFSHGDVEPLDNAALEHIVRAVQDWYATRK